MREKLVTSGGKLAGYLHDDGVWIKPGIRPKHLMRKFGDTPGIDADTFDLLFEAGRLLSVWAWNKERSWRVDADTVANFAKEDDFGHGRQYFLPLRYWLVGEGHASGARAHRNPARGAARRGQPGPRIPSLA